MQKLYTLLTLLALLFATSACEDDYNNVTLFEGVEPIAEAGTCNNAVTSLVLYLSNTEEVTLGIDGGDGVYELENEIESVAAISFAEDVNGYQRIKIEPLQEGETFLSVTDGTGNRTQLYIVVKECLVYKLSKYGHDYRISADIASELSEEAKEALEACSLLDDGGYYLLIPDTIGAYPLEKGQLEIYPTGEEEEPVLLGTYDTVSVEDDEDDSVMWQFTYENGQRLYYRRFSDTESNVIWLSEDVTSCCPPNLLPEGVTVFCREYFFLIEE